MGHTGAAAPGWYDDPNGMPTLRWWDGQQWTDQLAPRPAAQPIPKKVVTTMPRRRPSLLMNLGLTVVTCGLWLLVWIPSAIIRALMPDKAVSRYRY